MKRVIIVGALALVAAGCTSGPGHDSPVQSRNDSAKPVIALSHGDEADGFLKLAVATLAFSNSRKEKTE